MVCVVDGVYITPPGNTCVPTHADAMVYNYIRELVPSWKSSFRTRSPRRYKGTLVAYLCYTSLTESLSLSL